MRSVVGKEYVTRNLGQDESRPVIGGPQGCSDATNFVRLYRRVSDSMKCHEIRSNLVRRLLNESLCKAKAIKETHSREEFGGRELECLGSAAQIEMASDTRIYPPRGKDRPISREVDRKVRKVLGLSGVVGR